MKKKKKNFWIHHNIFENSNPKSDNRNIMFLYDNKIGEIKFHGVYYTSTTKKIGQSFISVTNYPELS